MNKWQVSISDEMHTGVTNVFIYREVGNGWELLSFEKGEMVITKIERGRRMTPTMILPWNAHRGLLQAFADAILSYGLRPEAEPVLENELTATKYHLEDMRSIVAELNSIKLKKE